MKAAAEVVGSSSPSSMAEVDRVDGQWKESDATEVTP
jgi:hypothetical protein